MVIAHQGGTGWDELLFVALPVALFSVLLLVADRHASKQQDEDVDSAQTDTERFGSVLHVNPPRVRDTALWSERPSTS